MRKATEREKTRAAALAKAMETDEFIQAVAHFRMDRGMPPSEASKVQLATAIVYGLPRPVLWQVHPDYRNPLT